MIKNDNGFVCLHCGKEVSPLGYTSRNHCPYCLRSLHIDNIPGDRANTCLGIMEPIEIENSPKKGYVIVYKCSKCGEIKKNKSADDDSFDKILEVMKNQANNAKF